MALIVELFGPPGAGKTTFAKALAARSRADGLEVGLHLSSRPGESETGGPASANFRRIGRPVWELIAGVGGSARRTAAATDGVAPLLAHLGHIKQLRMRQYLLRLSRAWAKAVASPGVFIFDQAYLQFAVTLLALDDSADAKKIEATLRSVPRFDVALCVAASRPDLAMRLNVRLTRIGALGRLLEAGAGSSERYLMLSQLLQKELERDGRPAVSVRSSSDGSFTTEIERAARIIDRTFQALGPVVQRN